ncbi:MAG TPA: hypothetical protein VGR00_12050, partial [Thermoanaerobaculia bacterium]|nr:hypothetical protein [Thermoanaerobaculia bacterium]
TGGKGLHVVTPLVRGPDWDTCLDLSRAVVEKLETRHPGAFTTTMSKAKRHGKIFLDYLRNARGATSVAAFSTRARPGAPVSVPLSWRELDDPELRPDAWNVANLPKRLATLRKDPWADYDTRRARVTIPLKKKLGLA